MAGLQWEDRCNVNPHFFRQQLKTTIPTGQKPNTFIIKLWKAINSCSRSKNYFGSINFGTLGRGHPCQSQMKTKDVSWKLVILSVKVQNPHSDLSWHFSQFGVNYLCTLFHVSLWLLSCDSWYWIWLRFRFTSLFYQNLIACLPVLISCISRNYACASKS